MKRIILHIILFGGIMFEGLAQDQQFRSWGVHAQYGIGKGSGGDGLVIVPDIFDPYELLRVHDASFYTWDRPEWKYTSTYRLGISYREIIKGKHVINLPVYKSIILEWIWI